ncbi:hypothetical protein LCGC14_0579280 [marine sediment metagenome]|uniref:Uncharacterized protein n=1 Tax=marine sediment metagenome TaxID=412755 RepID=A0A0F9RLU7_9ZZZZ
MNNESELADTLQHIVTLCGYYPLNENEIDVLVKYINRDDPTLPVLKLKEMFELAINYKLGIELKNRLSVKEYLRVKYALERRIKEKQSFSEIEKEYKPTKEALQQLHNDFLENIYGKIDQFFKTDIYKITDYGNVIYNYLERIGLITFSKEVQERFHKMEKITTSKNSNDPVLIKTIIDQSDKLTKMNYKKFALEQFLRSCKQENRDIIGEIKTKENMQGQKLLNDIR